MNIKTKEKETIVACAASVSVRFRSKERRTRVKDRAAKTENPVPRLSSVFLCFETTRKRLLRRLKQIRGNYSC